MAKDQAFQDGNSAAKQATLACPGEQKLQELAHDVMQAVAWTLMALGLGQNQKLGRGP